MAKRFTGTEKWQDAWFCSLTLIEKLFWVYLLDNCDNAGIWQVNWPLVQFHLPGFELNHEKFKDRYIQLTPEKWFIPKFIGFQYLTLNPANRAHTSVITKLQKEGVYKGLASPLQGAKDKDKDKESLKKGPRETFKKPTLDEINAFAVSEKLPLDARKFFDFYESKGWMVGRSPMKNWNAAARMAARDWASTAGDPTKGKPSWM